MNATVKLTGMPLKACILCGYMAVLLPCLSFDLTLLSDTCSPIW
jgi:hypothetical protein